MAMNSRRTAIARTPTEHHYVGKERDAESGNDFFLARYYTSTAGRWLSPDYIDNGLDPAPVPWASYENPQTLNLYSYGTNNPASYSDPDGHDVYVCEYNGPCTIVSNSDYNQAQKEGNSGLNVPTLDQVGGSKDANGNFTAVNITDANGNVVGTATYQPTNPGIDPFVGNNMAGYHTLQAARTTVNYATAGYGAVYGGVILGPMAEEAAPALQTAAGLIPRAAQSAELAVSARTVSYLESKGFPAAAASAIATKWLSQVSAKPTFAALRDDWQKLNQMVRDYRQSH